MHCQKFIVLNLKGAFENGKATFRYRKTGSSRDRRITVTAHEFIKRYLQHVLPTGFKLNNDVPFLSMNFKEHYHFGGNFGSTGPKATDPSQAISRIHDSNLLVALVIIALTH